MRLHLVWFLLIASVQPVFAQSDVEEIERLFRDEGRETSQPVERSAQEQSGPAIKDLTVVRNLEPYQDFVAIQRRFLPKSERWDLFGGGGALINDPFFYNLELQGRFGYNFSESWGVELVGLFTSGGEKDVTTDLKGLRGVKTDTLISPTYFYGVSVKYSPFYGKMSFFNHSIVPFDHYFTLGGGLTGTNQDGNPATLNLGTGQIYALSKRLAFRWDVTWLIFNADAKSSGATQSGTFNNVYLTAGVSLYFPEASYR